MIELHQKIISAQAEGFLSKEETAAFFGQKKSLAKPLFLSQQVKNFYSQLAPWQQMQIKDGLLKLMGADSKTKKAIKHRPKLFRALGNQDPPKIIQIKNKFYQQTEILKHDSWAATAIYQNEQEKIICKFNRHEPIFGLPMQWLGNWLARRENYVLELFKDIPNIPNPCGIIWSEGEILKNVSAHVYLEGTPLRNYPKQVNDDFFPCLQKIIEKFHALDLAYVDLNKLENILVDPEGKPILIDFQICFILAKRWPGNSRFARSLLHSLQKSDLFYLYKHYTNFRPDLFSEKEILKFKKRPLFLRLYRCWQIPLRTLRRKLLTLLKVRDGTGQARTEFFVEEAFRQEKMLTIELPETFENREKYYQIQVGDFFLLGKLGAQQAHEIILLEKSTNIVSEKK